MMFEVLERDFFHQSIDEIVSEMWTVDLFTLSMGIATSKSIQITLDEEDCSIVVIDPIITFFQRRDGFVCCLFISTSKKGGRERNEKLNAKTINKTKKTTMRRKGSEIEFVLNHQVKAGSEVCFLPCANRRITID